MIALLWTVAHGGTLPGVSVPFETDDEGRWRLPDPLPAVLADAGAQPGWVLTEVDGLSFDDPEAAGRRVAAGPARNVQLRFSTDPTLPPDEAPEVILVAPREPLVGLSVVETVPWPAGFAGSAGPWREDWTALPVASDAVGTAWLVDIDAGTLVPSATGEWSLAKVPDVFWNLSSARWAIDLIGPLRLGDLPDARAAVGTAAVRVQSWRRRSGDHLLLASADGIDVVAVTWPRGTPTLPTCRPRVPETCLASGTRILAELRELPGAEDEAQRHLGLACANGVNRACYESVALGDPHTAPGVRTCLDGDIAACNRVAGARLALTPDNPDDVVIGLLEYACELEGSGTLGERLRRVEEVGVSCMGLADAYDALGVTDQALLNLDQACVLGRADACDEASERRYQAFALRTVRECEDPEVPVAASCVELGLLLQERAVPVATVDDFSAFSRACTLGATRGCVLLGDYVDRWGIDHERVTSAESELQTACSTGEQRACVGAAHLLVRHEPKSEAYGEALVLFSSACAAGLADGCVAGAEQRRIRAARKVEAPDPMQLWTLGCELNEPLGCAGLGERMARSKTTWTDAYAAWTRACDLGDAHACSELGQLVARPHEPGWAAEQPFASYLARGCTNGDAEGCYWLAEVDLPSKGEPSEDAYVLLDQSCEGEHGPGCARLASVHLDRKTSFDDEIAARHLDAACNNGHFESCRSLGTMYLRGKGVERDRQRAKELFDRFRLNARRRHLRIGPTLGIAAVAGLEGELVLPIPVGPALSVGGTFSYLPRAGSVMVLIEGDGTPELAPNLQVIQAIGRLYPNPQARGLYGAVGWHQIAATGGSLADRTRSGLSGRVGLRTQTGLTYTNLEMGFGNYGVVDLNDFDEDQNGSFPLILPTFAFGFGFALL